MKLEIEIADELYAIVSNVARELKTSPEDVCRHAIYMVLDDEIEFIEDFLETEATLGELKE
jgi:hypothetical protein